ncbi:MAG TPA: hypothetical protein VK174_14965 [Chitinophagales bacterium]|nr:hypothetical protein [Chitinophagales bacterium]
MKIDVQYLKAVNGELTAVQIPATDWEKIVKKLSKYETLLKIKSDLSEAFDDVKKMRSGKSKKQTLSQFLDEL